MANSYSVVTDGKARHRLDFTSRDWRLLVGPHFDAGRHFVKVLGVYDHFTVQDGIPQGAQVPCSRMRLLSAAQQLLSVIQRDEDLLKYDYMFSFSGRKKRPSAGGEGGFHVRGLTGTISTRPHGYCHVNLVQVAANGMGRLAEYLDMRIRETLETDDLGTLRIHRKSAEMQWLDTLPPLIEFIKTRSAKQLVIEHYD